MEKLNSRKVLDIVGLAARLMLENGAETYRVEDTVRRMGKSFGYQVDVLALSTGILLSISGSEGHQAMVRRVLHRSTNLTTIDKVNALSRLLAQGGMTIEAAWDHLKEIENMPQIPLWETSLCAGMAAGLFAVMFGGQWIEFAVAFLCGLISHLAGVLFRKEVMQLPLSCLAGGAITALVSMAAFYWLDLDMASLESIISGAIIPLMSGLIMTNAVQDTMRGDLISGLGRAAEGLLVPVMVAAGLGSLMMFYLPGNQVITVPVQTYWISILCSGLATMAYTKLMAAPQHTMPITAGIAMIGYGVYMSVGAAIGENWGYFASAAVMCILSEVSARKFHRVTTLFLCTALIPLVPGLGLFRTMRDLVLNAYNNAMLQGANTLLALGSISLGIAIGSWLYRSSRGCIEKILTSRRYTLK